MNQLEYITAYFKAGEKNRKEWAVGVEIEHLPVFADTKKRAFYEDGIKDALTELSESGLFAVEKEGEDSMALESEEFTVTIEPGAQFELSLLRDAKILTLLERYEKGIAQVLSVLEKKGVRLVTIGTDPYNTVEEIPMIPKARYRMMNHHFLTHGKRSRNMMRQTCALQVAIDYSDEKDFVRKFRILSAMTPILYTLFDNAPYFEGDKSKTFNLRQEIWRKTDPARTGIIPGIFDEDFGYEKYAQWLVGIPMIFLPEDHDNYCEKTLGEMLEAAENEEEKKAYLEHGVSIVFPDIRLKQYIEIRQPDSMPAEYTFAAAALFKGLLYCEKNLGKLEEIFCKVDETIVENGKNSGRDNGIRGFYFSKYFIQWGVELAEMAREGLELEEEKNLLNPLVTLWGSLLNPREEFLKTESEEGFLSAIEAYEVRR